MRILTVITISTTDTLLLSFVVEWFREVARSAYQLDIAHYYTSPNLSANLFLEVSQAGDHLLSDCTLFSMSWNLIRVGISSVFSKHLASMMNEYLEDFDDNNATTYGLLVEANNLWWNQAKFPASG